MGNLSDSCLFLQANRSCYDLTVHANASGTNMHFFKHFAEPQIRDVVLAKPNKGIIGATFKGEAKALLAHLDALPIEEATALSAALEKDQLCVVAVGDKKFELTPKMLSFSKEQKKVSGENIVPAVIEPSYGIGRIIYSLLEQSYWVRNPENPVVPLTEQELREKKASADKSQIELMRGVLSLSPMLAPTKVSVIPLFSSNQEMLDYLPKITDALKAHNISHKVDKASQNIGKRYARTDELGIPFGITVDFDSIRDEGKKDTVTLRERDSTIQVRVPLAEVAQTVHQLTTGQAKWEAVVQKYPRQVQKE